MSFLGRGGFRRQLFEVPLRGGLLLPYVGKTFKGHLVPGI